VSENTSPRRSITTGRRARPGKLSFWRRFAGPLPLVVRALHNRFLKQKETSKRPALAGLLLVNRPCQAEASSS
jgi:hypothetical protein